MWAASAARTRDRPHDASVGRGRSRRARRSGACPAGVGCITKPPLKLSRVPSFSCEIWWHTVHDTPSAASACSSESCRADRELRQRCRPARRPHGPSRWSIGMWQTAHSSWIVGRGRRVIDDFAADARLEVRDRAPSSPSSTRATSTRSRRPRRAASTRLLWHAMQLSEVVNSAPACAATVGARRCGDGCAREAQRRSSATSQSRARRRRSRRVISRSRRSRRRTSPTASRSAPAYAARRVR